MADPIDDKRPDGDERRVSDRRTLLPRPGGRRETDRPPTVPKLACPECGADTKVVDSRASTDGGVYRRRECRACRHRFNTEEVARRYATKMPRRHDEHNI